MSLLCFHYHWNSDFGAWNKFKNTPKMGKFQAFLTLHIVESSCFFFILFYFIFFVFCFAKILFSSLVGKMLNVIHSREYTFLEKSSTCHDAMQHILCMLVFFPHPVAQYTPAATQSTGNVSNLYSVLHDLRTRVMEWIFYFGTTFVDNAKSQVRWQTVTVFWPPMEVLINF